LAVGPQEDRSKTVAVRNPTDTQVAILKATQENRWKPLTGLATTMGVGLLELLLVVFYAMFSKPAVDSGWCVDLPAHPVCLTPW
jgi:hypothetical protein